MKPSDAMLKDVLERIKGGQENFAPTDDSIKALNAFQPMAKALKDADERGLVERVSVQKPSNRREERNGKYYYASARGGLSPKGEDWLAASSKLNGVSAQIGTHLTKTIIGVVVGVIVTVTATLIVNYLGL